MATVFFKVSAIVLILICGGIGLIYALGKNSSVVSNDAIDDVTDIVTDEATDVVTDL